MPHHYVEVDALCEFARKRLIFVLNTSQFYGEQLTNDVFARIACVLRADFKHPDIASEIPEWARPVLEDVTVRMEPFDGHSTIVLYSGNFPLEQALTRIQSEATSTP